MKLVGELANAVENAKSSEEAKEVLLKAGIEITDEELSEIVGGSLRWESSGIWECPQFHKFSEGEAQKRGYICPKCGGELHEYLSRFR